MSMKNIAVIFDLNGTIVDTESAYFLAYKKALEEYGIAFTVEEFTDNWSTKGKKLKDYFENINSQDLLANHDEIILKKDSIFQSSIKEQVFLIDGSNEALKLVSESNIPCGLDSSTTRENIDLMLNHLNISQYFTAISSGDMKLDEGKYGPTKKKSSRLKYLADALGKSSSSCIVIGDAEKDIKGAKEAGMFTIAIPNKYTMNNDFSSADICLENLNKLTIDMLISLAG